MATLKSHFWVGVPNGGVLHATVTATNDRFNVEMGVDSSRANDDVVINHAKIVAGAKLTLRPKTDYAIRVRIHFAGTTTSAPTVTFKAVIKMPDGTEFEQPCEYVVKNPKQAPYDGLILIVTD